MGCALIETALEKLPLSYCLQSPMSTVLCETRQLDSGPNQLETTQLLVQFNSIKKRFFLFLTPLQADNELVKQHYIDLKDKPFYPGLCSFISSAPVFPMVWEGLNVVKTGRDMLGETDPVSYFSGEIKRKKVF